MELAGRTLTVDIGRCLLYTSKPTIAGERKTNVETYILDFDRDVYGKQARVNFLRFIRPEIRFDSIQALQAQIERDVAACRSFV